MIACPAACSICRFGASPRRAVDADRPECSPRLDPATRIGQTNRAERRNCRRSGCHRLGCDDLIQLPAAKAEPSNVCGSDEKDSFGAFRNHTIADAFD